MEPSKKPTIFHVDYLGMNRVVSMVRQVFQGGALFNTFCWKDVLKKFTISASSSKSSVRKVLLVLGLESYNMLWPPITSPIDVGSCMGMKRIFLGGHAHKVTVRTSDSTQ